MKVLVLCLALAGIAYLSIPLALLAAPFMVWLMIRGLPHHYEHRKMRPDRAKYGKSVTPFKFPKIK